MTDTAARSAFFDIYPDDPARAAVLTARAYLLLMINTAIVERGWTPAQTAQELGISTTRARQLVKDRGEFDAFSLEQLVGLTGALGLDIRWSPIAEVDA